MQILDFITEQDLVDKCSFEIWVKDFTNSLLSHFLCHAGEHITGQQIVDQIPCDLYFEQE